MRIPDGHEIVGDPHAQGRVAAQVLVGKEKDAAGAVQGPAEHRGGVARRADNATMPAAESFEAGCRVDVGDGREVLGVDDLTQILPGRFHLVDRRHVGHRTAGRHVGQDDRHFLPAAFGELLRAIGQDVGRLGHEVDSTEHDRSALAAVRGHLAELQTVAAQITAANDFVLLVVMPENQQSAAELLSHGLDPLNQRRVIERFVGLQLKGRQRLG